MRDGARPPRGGDLLTWPVIGRFLRWRHARTALQLCLLAAAGAVVLHGLFGPQFAPANLATVAVWIHYRGLLILALLAAGNLFCTGCPFVRVRDWGRRLRMPTRTWPRALRTKWIGMGLVVAILFVYERFGLWALPRATALLVLAYFAAALAVDLLFKGATFCKHLCPLGQFNFAASTVSPLEIRVRQPEICRTCATFDCIRGTRGDGPFQRGCELGLFLPRKSGNLDCTFCLDCVQACPHDNVGLSVRVPALELLETEGRRSGIGRLADRTDIAMLGVVFTFGALLNAFAMTRAARHVESWAAGFSGITSSTVVLVALFVAGVALVPAVLVGGAAGLTRRLAPRNRGAAALAVRYALTLLPIGVGIWGAHYGLHFLTGVLTIVPVTQSAVADLAGRAVIGEPLWHWTGLQPRSVYPLEVGIILLGAMASLGLAYGVSDREDPDRPLLLTMPWAAVILVVAAAAIWIFTQPMDMRGTTDHLLHRP